ncbi:MAG: hypothetical protein JNL39_15540 [Opitutaceae bacterium]|nr:hypothetical protein [Opitutaceae bacterium]
MQLSTSSLPASNPSLANLLFPGGAPVSAASGEEFLLAASAAGFSPPELNSAAPGGPESPGAGRLSFLPLMAGGAWRNTPQLGANTGLTAEAQLDVTPDGVACAVVCDEEPVEAWRSVDARQLAEALAMAGALPPTVPNPPSAPTTDEPPAVADCSSGAPCEEGSPGLVGLGAPMFEPRREAKFSESFGARSVVAREQTDSEAGARFALPEDDATEAKTADATHQPAELLSRAIRPGTTPAATQGGVARVPAEKAERSTAETEIVREFTGGADDSAPRAATPTGRAHVTAGANATMDLERMLTASVPLTPLARRWENSAADPERFSSGVFGEEMTVEKTFLSDEAKVLAIDEPGGGIEAAESASAMPTSAFTPPPAHSAAAASSALISSTEGLAERAVPQNVLALALDDVRSAHEAVEVVLRTADRLASLTHKSVRLEFAVAGERLDVRVELRANEVLTTFHTESAELRTALATEWQGVAASAGQGERTLRILPAEFGAAGQDSSQASAGDGQSRQREAAQQQQHASGSESFFSRPGRSSRAPRAAAVAPVADVAFAAPGTALHLHTVA